MAKVVFPTGKDIYLEVNGIRLAVAQSYKARTTMESQYVEAFGSAEPVGTIGGKVKHVLELTRVCAIPASSGGTVDFHTLSGFNVVIVKPDRQIIYSGCEWSSIVENAQLNDVVLESVTIVAAKRTELRA